jgi:hypothetical protein
VDFFFTSRVIILGLNLDLHELYLWWLLTYRARRKAAGKRFVSGEVIFLSHPDQGRVDKASKLRMDALKRKHDLLRAAGVNVVIIEEYDPRNRQIHYQVALERTRRLINV